jgi:predicted transcriptional regulator of viral defense system
MSGATTYARLRRLGSPITTGEAAAALRTSASAASRALRGLARNGLVRKVAHGLWDVAEVPRPPEHLALEIVRPYPAYVSFASALAAHGAIDQIPREIALASLGRPRRVRTAVGTVAVHRIPPELFGGFEERDGVPVARVEKAIVDHYYVMHASGRGGRRLPELDLPAGFSEAEVRRWIARIGSPRLRTLVSRSVARSLRHAEREERSPR